MYFCSPANPPSYPSSMVGLRGCDPCAVIERFKQVVNPGCKVDYVPLLVKPGETPDWYEELGNTNALGNRLESATHL